MTFKLALYGEGHSFSHCMYIINAYTIQKNQTTLFKTMIYFYLKYENVNKYGKKGVFPKTNLNG